MNVKKIMNKLSPLCFLPSGKLVCYKEGKLILLYDDKIVATYYLFDSLTERFLGRNKLLFRLFRMGVRAAIALDEDHILLSIKNIIYEYDFRNKELSDGYHLPAGVRPLIFTEIKNLYGFKDGIVFGGYLGNQDKEKVNVYQRLDVDTWEIVYTFRNNEINHVHNIVADIYRDCLWIFTGDFDNSAAIWKVTDNFKHVECVLSNNQCYRACVVFPMERGLLYATDTPFEANSIKMLLVSNGKYELKTICSIDGSCIYGCQVNDKYVFSSVVEPDGRNGSMFKLFTDYSIGPGILNQYAHLYIGTPMSGFKEVLKLRKDCLPFAFQFGTFRFPYGENKSDQLYFQPIATSKDLQLLKCLI